MTIVNEKAMRSGSDSGSGLATPTAEFPTPIDENLSTLGAEALHLEASREAPPAYGEHHDHVQFSQPGFNAGAAVTDDGRVNINIKTTNRRLRDLLAPTFAQQVAASSQPLPPCYVPPSLGGSPDQLRPPKLNVVVQIVGSRGDVQPFVALGKVLRDTYGHRVRIATHATFQSFVEDNGLEFFCIGGDPAELMAFMVKNPGLMPGMDTLKSGELGKRRRGIEEILIGCWRSCIEAGNGLGPAPRSHPKNAPLDLSQGMSGDPGSEPFVADAIVANPPSFAHIHIAEKLGIPLHMMFTMPWSPTRSFPHPLANVQSSNADDVLTSFMTYTLVEMMTWQGLGDIINRFREKVLDLLPLSLIWAPGLLNRQKIPYTYCWSPALIPKPNDWGNYIDVSGFFFLNLASSFTPEPALSEFLNNGPPPVYIGFGSIVVDDPNAMTQMIFDAVRQSGVRALVSKGWGGLGADDIGIPEGVFMMDNVPHDWLFQHVSCVVHHGGAGTTAAGIKAGKPTLVVPFFGDQPFWGAMIAKAKAGPEPVPYKSLTAEKLAESIKFCLKDTTQEQAEELGAQIREEQGTDVGGKSFHDHLDIDSLRCSLTPWRAATWRVRRTKLRLSACASAVLVERKVLQQSDLKLYRPREYYTEDQPPDPISACASSLVMDMSSIGMAIADMPLELFKSRQKTVEPKETAASQVEMSGRNSSDTASVAPSSTDATSSATTKTDASSVDTSVSSPSEEASAGASASHPPPAASMASAQRGGAIKDAMNRQDSSPVGVSLEQIAGTGRGVERIVSTGVRSPMNFCLGLAKGFRNVPNLYNDDTMRGPVEKVTDMNSGLRVASKELGFGLMDGIAGLVTQPLRGAEKEGAGGLVKGFGKGIAGLIAKPAAGFWAVPAYTMQGVHAEITKRFTRSSQNHILTSRITQGQREMVDVSVEEKNDIVARWDEANNDLKGSYQMKMKGKGPAGAAYARSSDDNSSRPMGFFDSKKAARARQDTSTKRAVDLPTPAAKGNISGLPVPADDDEFERAIEAAVRETSRGNAEEDARIEAAMRQSVGAIRQQQATASPAAEAPLVDAKIFDDAEYQITDEEYQGFIERAIQESTQYGASGQGTGQQSGPEGFNIGSSEGNPGAASLLDEDADLQRALTESRMAPPAPPGAAGNAIDEEELQRAIAASRGDMERATSEREEEEIVLAYIKKQSLAEEEHCRKAGGGKLKAADDGNEADDEELKRAIAESLKPAPGRPQPGEEAGSAADSGPSGAAGH